jgi:hypothetical protein
MADDAAAKRAWIANVLDVSFVESPPQDMRSFTAAWRDAVDAWRDASEEGDGQISALALVLRRSGDVELEEIADYGLNGMTGNFKVRLLAAIHDAGRTGPDARQAAKLGTIVHGFRSHLDTDERILGCDENPFGIAVSLRRTLGNALDQIEAALRLSPAR